MEYATLLNMDRQGRIVIPIQVRKALKLEEGNLLALEANERISCSVNRPHTFLWMQV